MSLCPRKTNWYFNYSGRQYQWSWLGGGITFSSTAETYSTKSIQQTSDTKIKLFISEILLKYHRISSFTFQRCIILSRQRLTCQFTGHNPLTIFLLSFRLTLLTTAIIASLCFTFSFFWMGYPDLYFLSKRFDNAYIIIPTIHVAFNENLSRDRFKIRFWCYNFFSNKQEIDNLQVKVLIFSKKYFRQPVLHNAMFCDDWALYSTIFKQH